MFIYVEDLCFSSILSKSDWYKYYCPRFSLGKCLREIKRKFSTTSIVWPFDLHAVITKSQFICSISVQGRLSVYRQSLLSPFMSFFGNEKMGKWRKVVKLPLFACKSPSLILCKDTLFFWKMQGFTGKFFRVRKIKRIRCILACPMYGARRIYLITL